MLVEKVPDDFLVRFYKWARQDFRREIDEGFPYLSGLINPGSYKLRSIMESLSNTERWSLATGLLKRFHPRAVHVLREQFTDDEYRLTKAYLDSRVWLSHYEQQRHVAEPDLGPPLKAGQRRRICKLIRKRLPSLQYEWNDQDNVFSVQIGRALITTHFYTAGRLDFQYSHTIQNREMAGWNQNMTLYFRLISILSWLGISSATAWSPLRVGDIEPVAESAALICKHFLEACPQFLGDIP